MRVRLLRRRKKAQKLTLTNIVSSFPSPFAIYADFESITKKTGKELGEKDKSFTVKSRDHECCDDELINPVEVYMGVDAVYKSLKRVLELRHYCYDNMHKKTQ